MAACDSPDSSSGGSGYDPDLILPTAQPTTDPRFPDPHIYMYYTSETGPYKYARVHLYEKEGIGGDKGSIEFSETGIAYPYESIGTTPKNLYGWALFTGWSPSYFKEDPNPWKNYVAAFYPETFYLDNPITVNFSSVETKEYCNISFFLSDVPFEIHETLLGLIEDTEGILETRNDWTAVYTKVKL